MITLRKFFVGLLALTTLVVAAYVVYEMTPERRARRVAATIKRLTGDIYEKSLENGFSDQQRSLASYHKRFEPLVDELFEIACRCEMHLATTEETAASWSRSSASHREGCLYSELVKEVQDHWQELVRKRYKERVRHALEESRE